MDDEMGELVASEKKKPGLKRWDMPRTGLMVALEKATNSEVQKEMEEKLMACGLLLRLPMSTGDSDRQTATITFEGTLSRCV